MRTLPKHVLLAATIAAPLAAQAHWTRLYPTVAPAPRAGHAMVFDAARSRCTLFGGAALGEAGDTWLFDGSNWVQGPAGPPARVNAAMAFDAARSVVVLFGGSALGLATQDTWEWNGTAWTPRTPAVRPSARAGHAMAFDVVGQRTVLFGGGASGVYFADTWSWNGTAWQQQLPNGPWPLPRSGTALAFDPNTDALLMFGGEGAAVYDDTWSFAGAQWTHRQPMNPPFLRARHAKVSDVHRRRVVLLGTGFLDDAQAWDWDGVNWSQQFVSSPTPRSMLGLAYDVARRQTVLFGGSASAGRLGDTWIYRTDLPADFAPLGAGCAGSLGTPQLAAAPDSLPWLGDTFASQVAPVAANGPAFFVTGLAAVTPTPLDPHGMPGCTLFVSPIAIDLEFATAAGVASWSLAIPGSTALAGVVLAQQCLLLDSGNIAGAVVSSARTLRIGVR